MNNEKIVKKPVMTLRKAQRITVRCTLKKASGITDIVSDIFVNERLKL